MPILSKGEIQNRINSGELVLHPLRDADGIPVVEPASYDLRAGIVIWKEDTDQIVQRDFDETKELLLQTLVTLRPGQMVFIITHEELRLPKSICGTVYSRNKLQKQNILALNAGHIDPGYEGPIMIRLINLGKIPWPLPLGDAVFTVVFHTVEPAATDGHARRTKQETLEAAAKTALEAFSNPFHDLYEQQIKSQLGEYYSEVESKLRVSFEREFFRRDDVTRVLFLAGAGIVVALAVLTRIDWSRIGVWLKII